MSDQSVWVGSFGRGLALLSPSGQRLRTLSTELIDGHGYVSSVAGNPLDNSVWAGTAWGGGVSRVRGETVLRYGSGVLPNALLYMRVSDIQVDRSSTHGASSSPSRARTPRPPPSASIQARSARQSGRQAVPASRCLAPPGTSSTSQRKASVTPTGCLQGPGAVGERP